jgi:hypothetical protein
VTEEISISPGNMKVGRIASFSLPPILSCLNSTHCASRCYARKAYRSYPNTTAAYDRNLKIAKKSLKNLKKQLSDYLSSYKKNKFRIHVSGDFFSQKYLDMWIDIAKQYPDIGFMAFTKVYWLDFSQAPENLQIIFSVFDTMPKTTIPRLRKKYNKPIALSGNIKPKKYFDCPGNCETCGVCWTLSKTKQSVFFHYH